ncbi:MAG: hypothetical protein LBP62_01865 [Clostridiales bacterium]|jgi:hypothetical protein|nr:hypothetical protein [Clostridiales bacterium]
MASEREIINLYCGMEKVFGEYSFWIREMTVFTVSGVKGRAAVIERFRHTANNIADNFKSYYPVSICDRIRDLYAERALIIIEAVRAYTYENSALYDDALLMLTDNNRGIASYFFEIDPVYGADAIRNYLGRNTEYIVQQLKRRFAGEFDGEIASFDLCYSNMIDMADYVSAAILQTVLE